MAHIIKARQNFAAPDLFFHVLVISDKGQHLFESNFYLSHNGGIYLADALRQSLF